METKIIRYLALIIIANFSFLCFAQTEEQIRIIGEAQGKANKNPKDPLAAYEAAQIIGAMSTKKNMDDFFGRKWAFWRSETNERIEKMNLDELQKFEQEVIDLNIPFIMNCIASKYERIDINKSIWWYRKNIFENNDLLAMYSLGLLYSDKDKNPDYARAAYWLFRWKALGGGKNSTGKHDELKKLYREGHLTTKEAKRFFDIDKEESEYFLSDIDKEIIMTQEKHENTYVLIIANEDYKYESKVQYAENDGIIFEKYCIFTCGISRNNIKVLKNGSLNQMRFAIKWLKEHVANNSNIIFYYAGHGIPNEQEKTAYLLPADGYSSIFESGVSLIELNKQLGNMTKGHVIMLIDACFSGTNRNGDTMNKNTRGVAIKVKEVAPQNNVVIFSAAAGDQAAFSYKKERHGLFSYYLLKKIRNNKGKVKLRELGDYLKSQVESTSLQIKNKVQTPTIFYGTKSNNWENWSLIE